MMLKNQLFLNLQDELFNGFIVNALLNIHWSCCIFSLYGLMVADSEVKPSCYIHTPPHPRGLGIPSGLPFDPHTTVISSPNHPERDVFVFPSGLNSLLKVYVLNKITVSPVLSWPLVAKQPCLPEGHSSSLCTDAHGAVHDSGRLKGTDVSIPKDC